MNLLKNKIVIGIVAVLLVVLLGGAGTYLILSKKSAPQKPVTQDESIKTISPSEIGLTLTLSNDKRNVEMVITKLDKIESIEGQFTYDTQEKDPDSGDLMTVPQGGLISAVSVSGKDKIDQQISLGTCSSGTCRYPKILSDIKFVIKVTYADGSVGQVEKTVHYPVSNAAGTQPQVGPEEN